MSRVKGAPVFTGKSGELWVGLCFLGAWLSLVARSFMEIAAFILAVGGLGLFVFAWPAWRRERSRRFPKERRWECSTMDVTPIAHRLEQVRSDFAGTLQVLPAARFFHDQLVRAARRAVSRLAFFRGGRGEPDNEAGEEGTV